MKTIFQKIITRDIPADIIYEDDTKLAFLDIAPVAKGHVLLISKTPYQWIDDVPDQELAELMLYAKKIIQGMKQSIRCDYVQLGIVGKDVPHFHIHLIPRFFDDTIRSAPTTHYTDDAEKKDFAHMIAQSLVH